MSFFRKELLLDARPYGRTEYRKAVSRIYIFSLILGAIVGFFSGFFGDTSTQTMITSIGFLAIYIFFAYALYKVSVLRVADTADNTKLAWLAVVPVVNLLFAQIYIARLGRSERINSPGVSAKISRSRLVFVFIFSFLAFGLFTAGMFVFLEETSTKDGIVLGVISGLLFSSFFTVYTASGALKR